MLGIVILLLVAAAAAGERPTERPSLRGARRNAASRDLAVGRYYLVPSTGYCEDEMYAPAWINTFFTDWNECCRSGSWVVRQCMERNPGTYTEVVVEQPETMVVVEQQPQTVVVEQQPATVVETTTTTSTTSSAEELEKIPLRFSLMGLPIEIENLSSFKDSMTQELKATLTSMAEDLAIKITSFENDNINIASRSFVFGRVLLPRRLQSNVSEPTQTVKLYYDLEVIKSPNQRHAPILIQAIRDRYDEVLGDLQVKSNAETMLSSFDLCTTSSNVQFYDDADFNICTLDHEIVPVKFSSSKLPQDVDRDDLKQELLKMYSDILSNIEGLEIASISVKRVAGTDTLDVYFDVDVINSDGTDWKEVIENELQEEHARIKLLDSLEKYLVDALGEDIELCVDEDGMLTVDCASVKSDTYPYALPMWAIITIASTASGLLLCCMISWCICARQNAKDEDDMKHNLQAYVVDEEKWRHGVFQEKKKKVVPTRRSRPRKERQRRHSPRRSKHHRTHSPRRRRSSRKMKRRHSSDQRLPELPPPRYNHEVAPPMYNRQQLPALPPPEYDQQQLPTVLPHQYDRQQLPALPSPQYDGQTPLALPPPMYDLPLRMAHPHGSRPVDTHESSSPKEEVLAIEGQIYCDDEEVNQELPGGRPDPPMKPGPFLMISHRQSLSSESDSSSSHIRLPIMPPTSTNHKY